RGARRPDDAARRVPHDGEARGAGCDGAVRGGVNVLHNLDYPYAPLYLPPPMTYAIFSTGGAQFRAEPGVTIKIRLLAAEPGTNVRRGSDDTLFTVVDGRVKFEHKSKKRYRVSVYPVAAKN